MADDIPSGAKHVADAPEIYRKPILAGELDVRLPQFSPFDGKSKLNIRATILDFNHNNGFFPHPLLAVWNGRNTFMPLSYSSPYTLEVRAEWVENPDGAPKYYLKRKEHFVHVADEKIGDFAYDFASYNPWEFGARAISPGNCPCEPEKTN
jgi:hypothetical protein